MPTDSSHTAHPVNPQKLARDPRLTSFRVWGFRVVAPLTHARLFEHAPSPTLPEPTSVLRRPLESAVKHSRTAVTHRLELDGLEPDGLVVYYKLDRARDLRDRIKSFFRSSRSRRAFFALRELASRGFAVPEPLACGERRRARCLTLSFLVTKEIANAAPLGGLVEALARSGSSGRDRLVELSRRLADLVRRLHASGIYHADLNPANVLVLSSSEHGDAPSGCDRDALDAAPPIALLDADRTVFSSAPISRRRRLKNLAQLNACLRRWSTLRQLVAFYRVYDPTFRALGRAQRRATLREIETLTWRRWLR